MDQAQGDAVSLDRVWNTGLDESLRKGCEQLKHLPLVLSLTLFPPSLSPFFLNSFEAQM